MGGENSNDKVKMLLKFTIKVSKILYWIFMRKSVCYIGISRFTQIWNTCTQSNAK